MMSIVQGGTARTIDYSSIQKVQQPGKEGNSSVASSSVKSELTNAVPTLAVEKQTSFFDVSKLNEEEKEKLEAELEKLNSSIASSGKLLKFKYDEKAEKSYVEVVDIASQKVVASLPPEFLIDLSIKMKEIIGMFIDKKL